MQISYSDSGQFLQLSHGANTHHLKHKDTCVQRHHFTFRILVPPHGGSKIKGDETPLDAATYRVVDLKPQSLNV